jgi:hypothetical protein
MGEVLEQSGPAADEVAARHPTGTAALNLMHEDGIKARRKGVGGGRAVARPSRQ